MYGIDLDEQLADHRYGWLLDRILDLPDPYSRFREAMSQDEEMAAMLLDIEQQQAEDDGTPATLRYSQVGLNESLLMSIDMGIKALRAESPYFPHTKPPKGKPKYPKPWPMPETAAERLTAVRAQESADRLATMFGVNPEDL